MDYRQGVKDHKADGARKEQARDLHKRGQDVLPELQILIVLSPRAILKATAMLSSRLYLASAFPFGPPARVCRKVKPINSEAILWGFEQIFQGPVVRWDFAVGV